jgi:NAD+-processing family protein with receiver domain
VTARYKIRMGRKDSVFLLEDSDFRVDWFRKYFPELVLAQTVHEAIKILAEKQFDWVFLDHDLGLLDAVGRTELGTGSDVARFLSGRTWIGHQVIIHSWNAMGAAHMKDLLKGAVAIPFGQFDIEFID